MKCTMPWFLVYSEYGIYHSINFRTESALRIDKCKTHRNYSVLSKRARRFWNPEPTLVWDWENVKVKVAQSCPALWDWNENWPFSVCGHCWVFQIYWHIECSTFTESSSRIWNSSTGIPSPPLALFVVMLPKAHLISHSRMSGIRWEVTQLWLFGSWRSFFV